MVNTKEASCSCRTKNTPRDEKTVRLLQNRLSRIIGQLGGISRMLDDNRYCADILTQLAAAQSALKGLGSEILQEHLQTCVAEQLRSGDEQVIPETVELIRRFL